MAKKPVKLPQNVQLLQRRYEYAQREFDREYQKRLTEFTGEVIPAYEEEIKSFEERSLEYLNRTNQYSDYLSSFFIKPGTNEVEKFVKYGNQYYWVEDIPGGFNLKGISGMPALSGTDFQFVKTEDRKHQYSYQSYETVPKQTWVTESVTNYELKYVPVQKMVYVPGPSPSIGLPSGVTSSIGSPISSGISTIQPINLNPGVSTVGGINTGGGYQMKTVYEWQTVPVTTTKQVLKTEFVNEFVPRIATENLEVGYLKTALPEGGFTPLTPEEFAVRSEPGAFTGQLPEAPPGLDIADIKTQLEQEKSYLQRETGEIKAASRRARMRQRARPLLS